MIKLTYCLRRLPELSWDEFSRYWREVHAPLVAERAEVLGIRRYVQLRTLQIPELNAAFQARNDGSPEPFDGVAELWIDSLEAFLQPPTDAATQASAELLADERNFIDLSRSPMWLGEELVVVGTT
jgi:uncharacterized protein (TIGR02118 family)